MCIRTLVARVRRNPLTTASLIVVAALSANALLGTSGSHAAKTVSNAQQSAEPTDPAKADYVVLRVRGARPSDTRATVKARNIFGDGAVAWETSIPLTSEPIVVTVPVKREDHLITTVEIAHPDINDLHVEAWNTATKDFNASTSAENGVISLTVDSLLILKNDYSDAWNVRLKDGNWYEVQRTTPFRFCAHGVVSLTGRGSVRVSGFGSVQSTTVDLSDTPTSVMVVLRCQDTTDETISYARGKRRLERSAGPNLTFSNASDRPATVTWIDLGANAAEAKTFSLGRAAPSDKRPIAGMSVYATPALVEIGPSNIHGLTLRNASLQKGSVTVPSADAGAFRLTPLDAYLTAEDVQAFAGRRAAARGGPSRRGQR